GTAGPLSLAEFGGEHDLVAAADQRLAEQAFVVAPAIHVGAVEKIDAALERVMDDANALRIVALAVGAGKRHAAETYWKDGQAAVAQRAQRGFGDGCHGSSWRGARTAPAPGKDNLIVAV